MDDHDQPIYRKRPTRVARSAARKNLREFRGGTADRAGVPVYPVKSYFRKPDPDGRL